MKRPTPWQARRIAEQKALRALPKCVTPDCDGKQLGAAWGDASGLCVKCASLWCAMHAQRERT